MKLLGSIVHQIFAVDCTRQRQALIMPTSITKSRSPDSLSHYRGGQDRFPVEVRVNLCYLPHTFAAAFTLLRNSLSLRSREPSRTHRITRVINREHANIQDYLTYADVRYISFFVLKFSSTFSLLRSVII